MASKFVSFSLFGGALAAAAYSLRDAESPLYDIGMPILHKLIKDPETAHKYSIMLLKSGLGPKLVKNVDDSKRLMVNAFGYQLANPLGVAAGMDKHAEAIDAFYDLGFALVEVGTITPQPQQGNAKPRYFRLLNDKAAINRYGFNSDGMEVVKNRLVDRKRAFALTSQQPQQNNQNQPLLFKNDPVSKTHGGRDSISGLSRILAVNIGKNKDGDPMLDYPQLINTLGPYADAIVVNISSPNTPNLRLLQKQDMLEPLLTTICSARDNVCKGTPVLIKIAPDLDSEQVDSMALTLKKFPLQGVIVANTTISRPQTLTSDKTIISETGGLSGPPLRDITLPLVKKMYNLLPKTFTIVACGGISSGKDAVAYARAGATLVEAHTALGYEGPKLAGKLRREIIDELDKAGVNTWTDLIGLDS